MQLGAINWPADRPGQVVFSSAFLWRVVFSCSFLLIRSAKRTTLLASTERNDSFDFPQHDAIAR